MSCGCSESLSQAIAQRLRNAGLRPGLSRREFLKGATAALGLTAAGCASGAGGSPSVHQDAAASLLDEAVSVDLHSHPGLARRARLSIDGHADRMVRGKVRLSLISAVADGPVLGRQGGRPIAVREPVRGELYAHTYSEIETVKARIAAGRLVHVTRPEDVEGTRANDRPGALLSTEGGDFLEGRLDRVKEASDRGIRSIQLVHYRVNELGDIQTAPAIHQGLTSFGKDVVREMNRLGMLVDLAHATFGVVKAAVEISSKPMLLSHTILGTRFSRAVSPEHAKLVAQGGGVIGIFPFTLGGEGLDSFITHIARMAEAVGVDHVAIGTDIDGLVGLSTFEDYAEWPSIPAGLLARGLGRQDVAKILGGNFLRVYRAVVGA